MDTDNAARPILVTTIMFLSLSGCARDTGSSEDLMMTEQTENIAAVNRLSEDYAAAWAKGDPELLLDCYADDAVVIMSHEDPIVGKEALRELYQHVLGAEKTEEEGGGMAAMAEAIGLNPEDYTFTTEGDAGKTEVSGTLANCHRRETPKRISEMRSMRRRYSPPLETEAG